MSMYTRCATCNTHFRVTVQQLQACSGQVRCGRCTTVFDAFATLTARPPGKGEEPPSLDTSVRTPTEAPAEPAPVRALAAPAAPAAVFNASAQEALALMAGETAQLASSAGTSLAATPAGETLTLPENLFADHGKRTLPGPAWAWRSVLGALGALALLQMLLLFRAELSASMPGTRTLLSALCRPVGCEVPLPRYPDSLYIESSDLQTLDSARPQEVLLTATVRNRADKLQAYPSLELTLTDTHDRAIAKRVFQPAEYLPAHQPEADGFAPGTEVNVRILLNTSDLRAAGYRLFLFFPT